MQTATYTPGYSAPVLSLMAQRTAETHAGFFLPQLMPGWSVLAAQFAAPSYCSLQDKAGDHSLFVALAWCEAIARAQ